jgi:hypothetical protein
MVLHEISIDDVNHSVYSSPLSKKQIHYKLCMALLENLCDEDYTRITTENRNNRKLIFFHEVVNCFIYVRMMKYPETTNCICGKTNITHNYIIQNIKTGVDLIVGSSCIENWFDTKSTEESCIFCGRNHKEGGNCINCSGKKNLKSVFSSWKKYASEHKNERQEIERIERCRQKIASDKKNERERIEKMELNEKVSFGMYKHLTYIQLCSDESIGKVKYVKWCLEESGMKDSITSRLRYFYNKHSIQNIQ